MKKQDKAGAGPQKMVVNLSLIEQYAGQSNTNVMFIFCCVRSTDKTKAVLPVCATGLKFCLWANLTSKQVQIDLYLHGDHVRGNHI